MSTDFWGVVVPNWIGALGGFAATALAIVSLVLAQRSRAEARAARATAEQAGAAESVTREVVAGVIAEASESERRATQWQEASNRGSAIHGHSTPDSTTVGTQQRRPAMTRC